MFKGCWTLVKASYHHANADTIVRRCALVYVPALFLISLFVALSWLGLSLNNGTFDTNDIVAVITWFAAILVLEVLLLLHVATRRKGLARQPGATDQEAAPTDDDDEEDEATSVEEEEEEEGEVKATEEPKKTPRGVLLRSSNPNFGWKYICPVFTDAKEAKAAREAAAREATIANTPQKPPPAHLATSSAIPRGSWQTISDETTAGLCKPNTTNVPASASASPPQPPTQKDDPRSSWNRSMAPGSSPWTQPEPATAHAHAHEHIDPSSPFSNVNTAQPLPGTSRTPRTVPGGSPPSLASLAPRSLLPSERARQQPQPQPQPAKARKRSRDVKEDEEQPRIREDLLELVQPLKFCV